MKSSEFDSELAVVAGVAVVAEVLRARAAAEPERAYVKCGGDWLTLGAVDRVTDRVAAGLAELGVAKGTHVALIVANRQEMVELFFACAKLGAVQVPLNCWLRGEFLRHQLVDCGAEVLVADEAGYRAAEPLLAGTGVRHVVLVDDALYADLRSAAGKPPAVDLRPGDLFSILYTSGTTGMPKGCMIPNGYYFANAGANREAGWLEPGDRMFTAYPLFHMSGHHALVATLVNEASVCVEPEFRASEFMARAAAEDATVLFGVGPMAVALLAQPPAPGDGARPFRMAMFTPLPPSHQAEFERRFETPVVAEGYGQTECSPATISSLGGERKRATVGRPVSYVELAVVDDEDNEVGIDEVGEIVLRPREPNVMFQGYWGQPDATLAAFRNLWHHTGDYGRVDAEGFVTFVDRKKDALRRRGENVSSFELEAAIVRHPAVAQVAVTAVPSPLGEDDIKATIVCVPGEAPKPDELFEYFKEHLPYFAVPRYVEVREALPVNALGRVVKHVLRAEGVTDDTVDLEAMGLVVARGERR